MEVQVIVWPSVNLLNFKLLNLNIPYFLLYLSFANIFTFVK